MDYHLFENTKQIAADSQGTIKNRLELEKERLLSGKRPEHLFQNPQQNKALKLLAAFFAVMLILTVVSRTATAMTIAEVSVETSKAGILTQRYTLSGSIASQNTIDVELPDEVRVTSILAQEGDRVKANDPLLEMNLEDVQGKLEQVNYEIQILDQKIANYSLDISTSQDEQIKQAEEKVKAAQQDYDLLLKSLELSENRSNEDMDQAEEDYQNALSNLDKAEKEAKDSTIENAENKLNDAWNALEDAQYGSDSAIASAQNALEMAQESASTAERKYNNALTVYNQFMDALTKAQERLEELQQQDPPASSEEIEQAQKEVTEAKLQADEFKPTLEDASENLDHANSAVRRAQEEVDRVREYQSELVDRADESVESAEDDLFSAQNRTDFRDDASVSGAEGKVDSAKSSLKTANRNEEDRQLNQEKELLAAQRAIDLAKSELKMAQQQAVKAKQSDESARLQNESEKLNCIAQRKEKQKLQTLLREISENQGIIFSPVDGTIRKLPEQTGNIQDGSSAVTLARTDKNFQFSSMVDEETAEQLSVGDEGRLSYTTGGKTKNETVQIASIGTVNEEGKVRVIVNLPEGSVFNEVSATLEIEKSSEQYQNILPLSSLRNIDGADVVLVIREYQSVMGTEQQVEAIEVNVKAQDSKNMAVEGPLMPDDQVVVSASKPIEKGDRVRVKD